MANYENFDAIIKAGFIVRGRNDVVVFTAQPGMRVELLDIQGENYRVRLPNGSHVMLGKSRLYVSDL